jgi:hypothetical protein
LRAVLVVLPERIELSTSPLTKGGVFGIKRLI